jgi:hypothetical protein
MPSALVDVLNREPESPFFGMIKRASSDGDDLRKAVVVDTGLVEAIRESLDSPSGVLFPYWNMATGSTDTESILRILITYWSAVRDVFPEAWGKPARRSKLMGGVGIRAMGRLMDRVMAQIDANDPQAPELARREVARIKDACHWTSGTWPEIGLPWNELQNVSRHISALSNFLARTYLAARKEQL